jgi:hypothetical protein
MTNDLRPLIVAHSDSSYAFETQNAERENGTLHFRFSGRDQGRDGGLSLSLPLRVKTPVSC